MQPRTIIVTGGIVSGIGKGVTAASLGRLLIDHGYQVTPLKLDPYLNEDAGTMNPFQHGEVFVTDDGGETDLDLGHYERFLDQNLTKRANATSGAIYRAVMDQERDGDYLGKTIQIIPHVTDEIQRRIALAATNNPDFLTVEIGGTVGDLEALPFLEAARQLKQHHPKRVISLHVVKMDYLYPSDEGKTKPIQHAVAAMRGYGISPDILVVRCKRPLTTDERAKLSLFCSVPESRIISAQDARSLYEIPASLEKAGLAKATLSCFGLKTGTRDMSWQRQVTPSSPQAITIGMVGKYTQHDDAYHSVVEALAHAGLASDCSVTVMPIDSEDEANLDATLSQVQGIVVPGGFGGRGIPGILHAISYARTNNLPFLGICYGLQLAVIESARSLGGLKKAHTTEIEAKTSQPVIDFIPGQEAIRRKGGTMRLGAYVAHLKKGSQVATLYTQYWPQAITKQLQVAERHRHRYEVNPQYHSALMETGLVFSGMSPDKQLVEYIERPDHPFFIATQAHPEFTSRPNRPHPLFAGLVTAAKAYAHR
jgi:CTP synthase